MLRIKKPKEDIKNKEIEYPLAIRITKDRKNSFMYSGYKVKEDKWDASTQRVKKNHKNSGRLNNYLIKKLSEATNIALELETIKSEVSSRAVKQKIKPTGGATFFPQAELYLENLKLPERSGMRNTKSMTGCEAPKGRYGLKTHLLDYCIVFMPYRPGELIADDYSKRVFLTVLTFLHFSILIS